jgi:chemotaxis signal transduction protein
LAERRSEAETADEIELLTFRVGAEQFALPVQALRGVVAVERCTRVPGAALELLGVIYVRGEIVPLVDTGRLLNSPLGEGGPAQALLCRAPVQLALGVDEILGIVRHPPDALRSAEASIASGLIEALLPDNTALLRLPAVLATPALSPTASR